MNEVAKIEREEMSLARDPEEVLKEARLAAQALTRVIETKSKKVLINGEQYLELADWELLAKFYGLTGKISETRPVQFGNVRGWEAHAVVLDRAGREISAADGMCLNDEDRWSSKAKYEFFYVLKDGTKQKDSPPRGKILWVDSPNNPGKKFPKKERVKVGEDPVPFFQLRSMAQTRALSKAFRNVLSWVVVLAGYKAASVEDFEEPEIVEENISPPLQPEPSSDRGIKNDDLISEEQKNTILAQLKKKNLALEHLEGYFDKTLFSFTRPDVNSALEWIRKQNINP